MNICHNLTIIKVMTFSFPQMETDIFLHPNLYDTMQEFKGAMFSIQNIWKELIILVANKLITNETISYSHFCITCYVDEHAD